MNYEAITLSLPGLEVAGLAFGPEDGHPVLALHGWLDNAASFERLAPLLDGLRIVALDLPGHGLSEHRPAGAAYHFVDWVVDVIAAADALGWEQFGLLAHSMGASIASLVAGTFPERVTHLALVEGLGPLSVSAEEAPLRLAKSIARRAARTRRAPRAHEDREAAAARLCAANPSLSAEGARILVARGTKDVEGGVTWRADPRLRALSPMRITEEHVHAFLKRVSCPTLLIRARAGYAFDMKMIAARAACIPRATVKEVTGGHHVHLDDPQAVAEVLTPFFAQPGGAESDPEIAALKSPGVTLEDLTIVNGIKLVVFDIDGVLTTGLMPWGPGGNDQLAFDVKDGMGIGMLLRAGIQVALLSGRDTDMAKARAQTLGIKHVMLGIKKKVPALEKLLEELGLDPREVAYMGDDLNDLAALTYVGYPTAPVDARPEVLAAARFVSSRPGGRGAARELAEHLLKSQGRWASLLVGFQG
jgi:YrbI family 3-deoxy-D-manno-octulosonate 8-phosphate phosphatase